MLPFSSYTLFFIPLHKIIGKGDFPNLRGHSRIVHIMNILILNGPNINLIGRREPAVYGSASFDDYFRQLCAEFPDVNLTHFQSNIEGELINKLHEVGFSYDGIILNAGAYTHTSIALQDAIRAITTPVIEVHISNVMQRESFRHTSMIGPACKGTIQGFGLKSYKLALLALTEK